MEAHVDAKSARGMPARGFWIGARFTDPGRRHRRCSGPKVGFLRSIAGFPALATSERDSLNTGTDRACNAPSRRLRPAGAAIGWSAGFSRAELRELSRFPGTGNLWKSGRDDPTRRFSTAALTAQI